MNNTLDYYNKNADEFILGTVNADMTATLDRFIKHVPIGGKILDLGCGSGRDSLYFKNLGYEVTAVDGSIEICKQAEKKIGQTVLNMMFNEIDFYNCFDGVWACASLLHVPSDEIESVISKIEKSLKNGGHFYCSFKYGDFEGERNGRFFNDYTEESTKQLFAKFPTFGLVDMWITSDARPDRDEKWVNCVWVKK